MEIERKFLVNVPENIRDFSHKHFIQGYLSTDPTVRVRDEAGQYFLTYKGSGMLSHEEYNLPLTEESFRHLIEKADDNIIEKTRYFIPYSESEKDYTIELDIFENELAPLIVAEVEFETIEDAKNFAGPEWFIKDVTEDIRYKNAYMSKHGRPD